ncbi:MAG TPA: T9SS type A sorting domain-containing protein, partial [Candidatus Marinimicrobia bacterium]|nr:T9SS type A sorting domain-containing protein [Candidatus Neomarinimicrobiota bacterium]
QYCSGTSEISGIHIEAFFLSSTEDGEGAWYRRLHYAYPTIYRGSHYGSGKEDGFSIRCLKDQLPAVTITGINSNNVGTEDSLTVNWDASPYYSLDSAFVDILYADTTIRVDTTGADFGDATIQVPDFTIESFQLIVTVWDYLHNEARDTSEFITVFDNTQPEIEVLTPTDGFSVPEYEELTVIWEATDNIDVSDSIRLYYSNNGGDLFTEMDSSSFPIPAGVTDSAQVKLIAQDIYGNEGEGFSDFFSVTDNTPPIIEFLLPVTGTELVIGSIEQITWSATDNDSISHVNLEYNVDGASWTLISENENDDGEYDWVVPNEPSNNVNIRVVAVDGVGLTDTSTVEGLSIIIVYPIVTSMYPDPGVIKWTHNELSAMFSQSMDSNTLTENIILISAVEGQLSPTFDIGEQLSSVQMTISDGFASSDTISVTINPEVTNLFGYGLDGNGDGVPGDAYSYSYYVQMLADYDTSFTVDALDLATFVQALEEDDLTKELGPLTGSAPHFYVSPDSDLNIEDVMGFVMMWNWYVTTHGGQLRLYENAGNPIEFDSNEDSIFFDLPPGVIAYEVQIQHDPKSITFGTVNSNGIVKIQDTDEELGLFNLICSPKEETRVVIPINISEEEANVTFSIRTIGFDRTIISQQTKKMTIENIPDQFALHNNYPNPFNPVTTIRYDLPLGTDVHLVVFDILGREVKTLVNEKQEAGFKSVKWNGRNDMGQTVSAGMYFYRIHAGSFSKVQKMVLLK